MCFVPCLWVGGKKLKRLWSAKNRLLVYENDVSLTTLTPEKLDTYYMY